jgi:hypothetical protein
MNDDYFYKIVKYVNMGLVYGQKKDGSKGKPFYRLGAVHRDLHETCPPELFELATKIFLREAKTVKMKPMLDEWARPMFNDKGEQLMLEDYFGCIDNAQVPFYMPEWLGGLGLVMPNEKLLKNKGWKHQCRIANFIRSKMNERESCPFKISEKAKWQFFTLAGKTIEDFSFLEAQNFRFVTNDETPRLPRVLKDEAKELFRLCVVDVLLTTKPDQLVKVLEKESEYHNIMKMVRHNIAVWKGATDFFYRNNLVSAFSELTPEDYASDKKDFNIACYNLTQYP